MKKITLGILGAVFLIALLFRFWKLADFPEAIDEDEMAAGYYGYSILHNGTDEYGNKLPIYFQSVGDYKYGLMFYLETIPVGIFGLNPVSTRSVSALAGSLSVIAIFFLAYEIFRKYRYALIAALLLAVNPIHIHFSRVAYTNVLGALFAVISIILYLRWIKDGKLSKAVFSFLAFILAIYTYQANRVFLPVIYIFLPPFYYQEISKKKTAVFVFSLLILIGVAASFIPVVSRARSQDITTLINVPQLTEQINEDGMAGSSLLETRAFHNKVLSVFLGISGRYLSYFNPKFLFVESSSEPQRHTIPGMGILYLIEAPFFILGLIFMSKYLKKGNLFVPLIIFFAAPVAASMVIDPSSTTRSIAVVFGASLITAIGIYELIGIFGRNWKYVAAIIAILYAANISYFVHQYTVQKIYHHPWYSDVGLHEMVEAVAKLEGNYENVAVEGGHYMPFIFYNAIDPKNIYGGSDRLSPDGFGGVRLKSLGKLVFNMPGCPTAGKPGVLYVCFGYKVPKAATVREVIRYKDGQPAIILSDFTGITNTPEKLPERVEYSNDRDERFPNGILPENYATFWPVK